MSEANNATHHFDCPYSAGWLSRSYCGSAHRDVGMQATQEHVAVDRLRAKYL